jgi:uncharacterized protein YrzB (UPF0473 family)
MNEQLPNLIELIDENDETITFEHIMTLDYDGSEYVVLAPVNEGTFSTQDEEDEVVILRVEQDENGDDYYTGIEDESELDEVFSAVMEVYGQSLQ